MTDKQLSVLLFSLARQLNMEISYVEDKVRERFSLAEGIGIVLNVREMAEVLIRQADILNLQGNANDR